MIASPNITTLLLTGFGPFPGVSENASHQYIHKLAPAINARFLDVTTITEILQTEWSAGPARLQKLMQENRPDLCLHFGVSDRACGFVIEARAYNACDPEEDAGGMRPKMKPVMPSGPQDRPSTFPAERIVSRLKCGGFPAELSHDPGRYLCNAILYHSLTFDAEHNPAACSGFVHLPTRFSAVNAIEGWTLDRAVAGGIEIVATCLETLRQRH